MCDWNSPPASGDERAGGTGDGLGAVVLLRPNVELHAPEAALARALADGAVRGDRLTGPEDIDKVDLHASAAPPAFAEAMGHHVGEEAGRERPLDDDLRKAELLRLDDVVVVVA